MKGELSPELREALVALKRAVKDQGPVPRYHHQVMRETYKRWPTLWLAVEQVLAAPEVRRIDLSRKDEGIS